MMIKRVLLLAAATLAGMAAVAQINVDGTSYNVDTIIHRQVGPGVVNTIVRLPEYPLNVYILEADLSNTALTAEATIGQGIVGKTELLVNAAQRQTTATKRPFAACNANFWVVGGSGAPLNQYALGTPLGCVVRNDTTLVNTNTSADQWNGGPDRTGATAITHDGRAYVGRFMWYGRLSSTKIDGTLDFYNINRRCLNNDLALWNVAYTRTRPFEDNWVAHNERGDNQSDNYYLTFKPGSGWAVNKPMTLVVGKIVRGADSQTLGDYDACFTATGTYKEKLAALQVGDELTVTSQWCTNDPDCEQVFPDIANMVEGNAYVMHKGELTGRNYDETYNSQVYSRTCYGTSADGRHLYMMVIDKSDSKAYGRSAGCPTAAACQILKALCPDVTEIANYDAGGSAEMLVDGVIINTTTEGTPRPVASGMMLVANGEVDNEIASIAFEDYRVRMPIYASYVPKVWGYNARGEVVSKDVKGFELTCEAAMGTTDGDVLTVGGMPGQGWLTATYRGLTATVPVTTLAAQPAIKVRPLLVIDDRDYAVEVTATVDGKTFGYDPARLQWSVDDETVATIAQGVLHGRANGTTRLHCHIGDMDDEVELKVEISGEPYRYEPWTEWTLKGSGAKDLSLADDGTLTFTYNGGRAPYVQLRKAVDFYSLPDTIGLTFVSTIPIDYVQTDVRNNFFTSAHYVKYGEDTGYQANTEYTIKLDLDAMGGADQVSTYPLTLNEIKFVPNKSGQTGEQTIWLKALYAHYATHRPGMPGDVDQSGSVGIEDVNAVINVMLGRAENPLADVDGGGSVGIEDVNAVINIMLGH
ncbi:MAG: phosphodiester glycosidase family protein [Muribaculaceae bacterium]|nr:phosphodiester glycosidase family protein [Muribaculaceae bacterium]